MTTSAQLSSFESFEAHILAPENILHLYHRQIADILNYCRWAGAKSWQLLIDSISAAKTKQADISADLTACGVPKKELPARLSDFSSTIQRAAQHYLSYPAAWIYIHGTPGTGKTWLATAIIAEQISTTPIKINFDNLQFTPQRDQLPLFTTGGQMITALRSSYGNKKATEKDMLEKYLTVKMLVIDDLSVINQSETTFQFIYEIINHRSSNELKTVITDNLSLKDLEHRFDDRIASRIAGMCQPMDKLILRFEGHDKRIARPTLL